MKQLMITGVNRVAYSETVKPAASQTCLAFNVAIGLITLISTVRISALRATIVK